MQAAELLFSFLCCPLWSTPLEAYKHSDGGGGVDDRLKGQENALAGKPSAWSLTHLHALVGSNCRNAHQSNVWTILSKSDLFPAFCCYPASGHLHFCLAKAKGSECMAGVCLAMQQCLEHN